MKTLTEEDKADKYYVFDEQTDELFQYDPEHSNFSRFPSPTINNYEILTKQFRINRDEGIFYDFYGPWRTCHPIPPMMVLPQKKF